MFAPRVKAHPKAAQGADPRPPGRASTSASPGNQAMLRMAASELRRSAGRPLDTAMADHFSPRLRHDLSRVRIHDGPRAGAIARALRADAFTIGRDIAFAPGMYRNDRSGRRLLGHELAHVAQQGGGGPRPGKRQERDADDASRAIEAGEVPEIAAPSQVGIAAQESADQKDPETPIELVTWFQNFYLDRLGYQSQETGPNQVRLINPNRHHYVDITLDPWSPRMVSVILAGKSYEVNEYNFSTKRFETRDRYIEQVPIERKLSLFERIMTGITVVGKVAGGAGLCVVGSAETFGFGAAAACAYGADLAASAVGDLRGEDGRTLSNRLVSSSLSHLVGKETAQQMTDNAEGAINIVLTAHSLAYPPRSLPALPASPPELPNAIASEPAPAVPEPAAAPPSRPMKKLPGGALRGTMTQGEGKLPTPSPKSQIVAEYRSDATMDLGKPEYSVDPDTPAPEPPTRPRAKVKRAPPGYHQAAAERAKQARAEGFEKPEEGRLGLTEHRGNEVLREVTGRQGQESLHLVPQVVYDQIGVSPEIAPTLAAPREVNTALDAIWKRNWRTAVDLHLQVTGGDIRQWVKQGIRSLPDSMMPQAARNTAEFALDVEMMDLGITDDTVILEGYH